MDTKKLVVGVGLAATYLTTVAVGMVIATAALLDGRYLLGLGVVLLVVVFCCLAIIAVAVVDEGTERARADALTDRTELFVGQVFAAIDDYDDTFSEDDVPFTDDRSLKEWLDADD